MENCFDNKLRILFADDDQALLGVFPQYLSWLGFEVEKTSLPEEILEKLGSEKFDLLIYNMFMQSVAWKVFLKNLRSHGKNELKNIKILVYSSANPEDGDFLFMQQENLNFINKYESMWKWAEKIKIICA